MPEERKLVTVLFADIVGSTALTAARDPELVRGALRRAFDELRPIVEAHGGTVEKFIGDEVMAVFGVPAAHDDDADRAVRAAFAMRDKLHEMASRPNAVALETRIGINTGEAVADTTSEGQFLVTGLPVNAAARIRGAAEPGEILAGPLTHGLTARSVEYGEPRAFDAKGIGALEAWPARALRSDVPAQFRGVEGLRAPLIGRDAELALLLNAFDRTRSEARAHLATVFGAAGAGKSRLTEEFVARIGGSFVRQGRCLPYGEGITLWPIQQILRADIGIPPTDDLATARQRVVDAVGTAFAGDDDASSVRCRLEVLAGLARADEAIPEVPASELSEELAWGLRRYLERRATAEPLVLVFEDIHWAAPALLDLIEHLTEWAKAPLFVLCLARPEFLDTRAGWAGGKVNAASIILEPLTPDETRELVAKLLDIDSLTEDVRRAVIERAEGNPLYVEEFIRLLIETGQIAHRGGRWIATNVGPLQVPPTLQGLIAARVDTAPAEVKRLLQRASVVGRFFATTGVAAISDGRAPEPAHLRDAVRRDLLVEADERGVGGGRVYRFKHVLIRDVVYASVPKSERSVLHDRYSRWYEAALGDRREDFLDLIAYHAEQAFLLAAEMALPDAQALARRAFELLMVAATKARLREDWGGALALYRRAADAADTAGVGERIELDGYNALARHLVEATPEANAALGEAIERARAADDVAVLSELLAWDSMLYPADRRRAAHEELRALAVRSGDPVQAIRVIQQRIDPAAATTAEMRDAALEVLGYARDHGLTAYEAWASSMLVTSEAAAGHFADAQRHLADWTVRAGASPTIREKAGIRIAEGALLNALGEGRAAVPLLVEAVELWRELGNVRMTSGAMSTLAVAVHTAGDLERALAVTDERIALMGSRFMPYQRRGARATRARLLAALGRLDAASAALADARAVAIPRAIPDLAPLWADAVLTDRAGGSAGELFARLEGTLAQQGILSPLVAFDHAAHLVRAGDPDGARGVLLALRARLAGTPAVAFLGRTDELLAEIDAVRA